MSKDKLKRRAFILILIICIALFGYLRDFLFVNINTQIGESIYVRNHVVSEKLEILKSLTSRQLVILKWILTVLFTLTYFFISFFVIKFFFVESIYIKILAMIYLALFILSFLAMSIGFLYSDISAKCYHFSRFLMGIVQSPLVLMILIPAFKISKVREG